MNNKKFSLQSFLIDNTIPVLLMSVLFSSVIYIYSLSDGVIFTGMTIVAFFYSVLLFLLLDFLRVVGKTWFTTIFLFIAMVASIMFGSSLIETGYADTTQWFFEPDKFSQIYVGNIASIIVMVGFVLGSAMYYFTRIRFRGIFIFLICMCPFSLFAKSFTDIPVIFTIIIITLFFLLLISKNYTEINFIGINKFSAIGLFIIIVTAGAAFLPKLEYAPYREEFDEFITGINISGGVASDFNNFTDSSSYSRSNDDDDEVLYTIYGDNPVYLKRQCFNSYNSEKNLWEYSGEVTTGYNYYSDYIKWENPSLLASECGINLSVNKKSSIISSESDSVHALYTPDDISSIEFPYSSLSNYGVKYVYRTPLDEYFHTDGYSYNSYKISWYDFDTDIEFMLLYDDTKAESINMANSKLYLNSKKEMVKYYENTLSEDVRESCYKSLEEYERVKKLTDEIIVGCTNDYEKAFAIEQYFKSDDYVYDKEFVSADGSVENFIFNTKRGICTNYATSMVLMCREAGLYARYVEGFLVQKVDDEGNYYVTAADSHAYVQVWLNGYGWTTFDPTSSNIDNGGYFDPTFLIVGSLMLLIIIGGIIVFVAKPLFEERKFIKRVSVLSGREQLIPVFKRINYLVHKELGIKLCVLTISELKTSVFDNFGIDISPVADDFECVFYGNVGCERKDYVSFYYDLKKAIKEKKSVKKKCNK